MAPDTFRMRGDEALAYHPNPEESQREQVLRAAAACPVQAILVEDTPIEATLSEATLEDPEPT
ncbi:hypothetical protein Ssi02_71290 [Sinosporangium siamense]|uniref:Ferredoxin n=2 Tax=Sinosporangium siamense TaxID=1367973 RepID=A0A919RND7_9ACTN|nr:hypothetical protein Ssi02_71290 [Sinosporangium siamense]